MRWGAWLFFATAAVGMIVANSIVQQRNKPVLDRKIERAIGESRYLDGVERESFLKAGEATCFSSQRKLSGNNISDETIRDYCRCVMAAYADTFVVRELYAPVEKFQSANRVALDRIRDKCAAETRRLR